MEKTKKEYTFDKNMNPAQIKKAQKIIDSIERKRRKLAKAEVYNDQEAQEIITGKRIELVNRQREYRREVLSMLKMRAELTEYSIQIDAKDKNPEFNVTILWYGSSCPIEILKADYNLKLHDYKNQRTKINYIGDYLKKVAKMSNEDIDKMVCSGIYVNNLPAEVDDEGSEIIKDYTG